MADERDQLDGGRPDRPWGDGLLCAADLCSVGHYPPWPHAGPARDKAGNCPARARTAAEMDPPRGGCAVALTAATAVLSFSYLGSRTAPQDPLDATGTALSESVTLDGSAVSLWVYPGISFGGSMTVTDATAARSLKRS